MNTKDSIILNKVMYLPDHPAQAAPTIKSCPTSSKQGGIMMAVQITLAAFFRVPVERRHYE